MRFLLNLAVLSALAVGTAAAQDRVSELEDNVNAAGFTRRSMPLRIGAEVGMGLLGEALTLGGGFGLGELVDSMFDQDIIALGTLLVTPAVTAAGVYYGGKWTGGRGSLGWPMLSAYLSSVAGIAFWGWSYYGCSGLCLERTEIVTYYTLPLWPLLGSIIAYEVTDRSATNKLKDKRKGLKQAEEPLMFQLLAMPF